MTAPRHHYGARGAFALACGLSIGTYVYERQPW